MSIRVVCFDFWQTLFAETPESAAASQALRLSGVAAALARAGFPYDLAALEAADLRALVRLREIWATHRDVAPAEQVRIVLAALDPGLPSALKPEAAAVVERAYRIPVLLHPPVVAAGAAEAVRALTGRGLTLAIVSNTGRTPGTVLRQLLGAAGLLDAFRVLSFSDEVGVRKPDPTIFRRTVAQAGCPSEAAVHVGDDAVADVGGARAAGMRGIHYVAAGGPHAADADGVIRHLADLPALVAQLDAALLSQRGKPRTRSWRERRRRPRARRG